jgi:hypothetical protein
MQKKYAGAAKTLTTLMEHRSDVAAGQSLVQAKKKGSGWAKFDAERKAKGGKGKKKK